jgi:cellulose biosynthesis protein BcsQ
LPITLYAPTSKGAEAYEQLAQEVMAKNFLKDKPQKELVNQ